MFRFPSSRSRLIASLVAAAVLGIGTIVARRQGYGVGGRTVVRCRDGHLFTTIWIPGASLKSLRLGWWRWQHCPIGDHWALVSPVREADLTDAERRAAARLDTRIP